jgi:hypothetical protein
MSRAAVSLQVPIASRPFIGSCGTTMAPTALCLYTELVDAAGGKSKAIA